MNFVNIPIALTLISTIFAAGCGLFLPDRDVYAHLYDKKEMCWENEPVKVGTYPDLGCDEANTVAIDRDGNCWLLQSGCVPEDDFRYDEKCEFGENYCDEIQ